MNQPSPERIRQLQERDRLAKAKIREAEREYAATHVDTAENATSSLPSPETAKTDASVEPNIDFTFSRGKNHQITLGKQPFVLLRLTDGGVTILGGGLRDDAPNDVVIEFLQACGDTFHQMAQDMLDAGMAG